MHSFPLDGSYNARGIGRQNRPWVVRSAGVDALTERGERTLRELGVDIIIDLREASEQGPRRHDLPVRSMPLFGHTPPASGRLEELYAEVVQDRGTQVAAVVAAVAAHPGTALVHCTAGKDRTGIVVALTRLAAGDDRADVVADYAASGAHVRPARAAIAAAQMDAHGLAGSARTSAERLHLDSPAPALEHALALVEAAGGVEAYLLAHGATSETLARLRAKAAREAVTA